MAKNNISPKVTPDRLLTVPLDMGPGGYGWILWVLQGRRYVPAARSRYGWGNRKRAIADGREKHPDAHVPEGDPAAREDLALDLLAEADSGWADQ